MYLKSLVVLFLLWVSGPIVLAQQESVPNTSELAGSNRDFESFVALFPPINLPFEVSKAKTIPENFPLLPADSRLRNYGECFDYRAIGRLELNDENVYLIHYHWCDELSPTTFYNLQIYTPEGKLVSTMILSSTMEWANSWSKFSEDKILTTFDNSKARKEVIVHKYSFDEISWGKKIFCSDGWCTLGE
jgi:hypothetical protein